MIRNTKQRDAIRRAIQEAGRPLSAAKVLSLAGLHVPGLGVATVYRTLNAFLEEGSVVAVPIPGGRPGTRAVTQPRGTIIISTAAVAVGSSTCPGVLKGWIKLAPPGFSIAASTCCSMANVQTAPGPRAPESAGSLPVVKASDGLGGQGYGARLHPSRSVRGFL